MLKRKIKSFFRWLFRRPWWTPNNKSKKALRKEADKIIGYDKTVNKSWSTSWKYFIKRQFPWYGILEMTQYKIIEMRDYMQNYSIINEEATNKQIKQMTEVIDLGYKILADEYENFAHKWSRENTVPVVIISQKGQELTRLYNHGLFSDIIDDDQLYADDPLSEAAKQMRRNFLKDKDTRSVKEWLKDNNLTEKEIKTAYTSAWINGKSNEENSATIDQMYSEAWQDRRNDVAKYFECIGEYVGVWGD